MQCIGVSLLGEQGLRCTQPGGADRDASTAEDFPLGPVGGSFPDHTFDNQEPGLDSPGKTGGCIWPSR